MHDLTAGRIWGLIHALAASGLVVLGDKGYLGEEGIRTLYRGRNKAASQKDANSAHGRLRAPGERANAQLACWQSRPGGALRYPLRDQGLIRTCQAA